MHPSLTERKEKLSPAKEMLLEKLRHGGYTPPESLRRADTTSRSLKPRLSYSQLSLWLLAQMDDASHAYHIPLGLRISGRLDRAALRRALDRIVERHEVLRTTFALIDQEVVQQIRSLDESRFCLLEQDLRQQAEGQNELDRLIEEEANTYFDLRTGPLVRGRLVRLSEEEHVLLITFHHIIADGWSLGLFRKELSILYSAFLCGEGDALPTVDFQYSDYAAWQYERMERGDFEEQGDYWLKTLAGSPELLEVPTDRPRPTYKDYSGSFIEIRLNQHLTASLRDLCKRHGATLYITLLSAWAALLSRISGQQDILIGTPQAGRDRVEFEKLLGFFVNTLVLRLDLSGNPTIGGLVERVKERVLSSMQNRDFPFEQVVEMVRPMRNLAHTPVFQVMFAWQDPLEAVEEWGQLVVEQFEVPYYQVAKFDMSLSLCEDGDTIVGGIQYATALFEPATVERFVGHFKTLLGAMVEDETRIVDELPLLSAAERQQMLYEWNDTRTDYPSNLCIHEMFETQVRKTPNAVAVVHEKESLTYRELNCQANQLAHYLNKYQQQCGESGYVVTCLKPGPLVVVSWLAILKRGWAFIAMDPDWPRSRIEGAVDQVGSSIIISDSAGSMKIASNVEILCPSDWRKSGNDEDEDEISGQTIASNIDSAVYVFFTSGSTGMPKAVANAHRGVLNRLSWMTATMSRDAAMCVVQTTRHIFDSSVWQIFWPLIHGGKVIIPDHLSLSDPQYVFDLIDQHKVTAIDFVPSVLEGLMDSVYDPHPARQKLASLEVVIVGGEESRQTTLRNLANLVPGARMFNLYGPTEASIGCICHEINDKDLQESRRIPIGRPIANCRVYVFDLSGQEFAPIGVTGELYLGGTCLGLGYVNDVERTQSAFVYRTTKGKQERLYRTGDLVRWRFDGELEFMGRKDAQVKIRGYRIELEEIETKLIENPDVRKAVAIVREDTPGKRQLVAYYTSIDDSLGAEELRSHLSDKLPSYMVPMAYVRLDSFPLTPNGKLDVKALPTAESFAYLTRSYELPQGKVETQLAKIWEDVLKLERVGRFDNFFELGGHSLLAVQTVIRIQNKMGVEVTVRDLFARPSLIDLAHHLEQAAPSKLPSIERCDRSQPLPLSFAQQRLWFLAQMEGVSESYYISWGVRMEGELDRLALRQALDRILSRHEALRTTFHLEDGNPVSQVAAAADSLFLLIEHDLRQQDELHELERLVLEEAKASFDLAKGPLIRGRLVQLADHEHVLLITMHHIVSDGWSIGIFINELNKLYSAFRQGAPDPLDPLQLQYADYAVWQRRWIEGEVLREQAEFWRANLAEAPALLELPADHPRPAQQTYAGAFANIYLDMKVAVGLRALSKRHGTTLYMTLLTAWAILLARLSGQQDIVTGTPVANRGQTEIEPLIGFFVNTLVLRLDLSGSPTVAQLLERVKMQTLTAQQHQDIPFEQVVELLRPVRSLAHSPIFQVMFAWQNTPHSPLDLPGLKRKPLQAAPHRVAKFDLTLSLGQVGEAIGGGLEYATALFEPATIERYIGYFKTLLGAMVADETRSVDLLPMLSEAERNRILYEWNATRAEYPSERCVHELFEAQVERTPAAVAVVFEDEELSYGELNRRANRLAHYLRELGVKPDDRVAICVERGFEMMIGLMAVLKAGGAYVPLDPAYPVERLRFILEDSEPVALLTQADLLNLFENLQLPTAELDDRNAVWRNQPDSNPDPHLIGLNSSHLAYVIFTSGSTGHPKGVMVQHDSLVNFLYSMKRAPSIEPIDALLAVTTFSFDIAALELYLPLIAGARVVMAGRHLSSDVVELIKCLQCGITVLQATPATWRMLFEAGWKNTMKFKALCGGEALNQSLSESLFTHSSSAWNLYGPTETTVWSVRKRLSDSRGDVSIGRPIANTRIYILDGQGEPVPVGVVGELYIGGAGVARGYLNLPELTAERFLSDPFSTEPGARMYRTGDLGRYLPDGNIEFLGRSDFQVKIRGFRIELGEIEARLVEHPGVRDAVVIAREDQPGEKRLVAYYTAAGTDRTEAELLRSHLSAALPEYMVPSAYVHLDSLPLTPNGKLNRMALPVPDGSSFSTRPYEAPQGETELALAEIWTHLLRIDRVGRRENFFDLGGHSLLAMRLINRIRSTMEIEVQLVDIFEASTIKDLAALITEGQV